MRKKLDLPIFVLKRSQETVLAMKKVAVRSEIAQYDDMITELTEAIKILTVENKRPCDNIRSGDQVVCVVSYMDKFIVGDVRRVHKRVGSGVSIFGFGETLYPITLWEPLEGIE